MLEPHVPHTVYLINNGRILNLTVTEMGEMTEEALLARLQESGETSTGLMPFGCRYLRRCEGMSTVVVEYPPQIMTVRFQPVCGPTISRVAVPILLPWQIYVFRGNTTGGNFSVHMLWRNARLRSLSDEVLNVVMPNMEPGGVRHTPCIGNMTERLPDDIMEKITMVTTHLMASPVNDDLDAKIQRMLPDELRRTTPTAVIGETVIPAAERREGSAADYILRLHAWNNEPRLGQSGNGGPIAWRSAGSLQEFL